MLTVEPDAACEWLAGEDPDDPVNTLVPCGEPSRFVVERSVEDPAYSPFESCADHLADAVLGQADGDAEVPLVVTVRWDKPEDETEAERLARVMIP